MRNLKSRRSVPKSLNTSEEGNCVFKFKVVVGLNDGTWKKIVVSAKTGNDAVEKAYSKHKDEIAFVCGVETVEE